MLNVIGVTEAEKIDEAIEMLKLYAEKDTIQPFLSALELLKGDPDNESLLTQLKDAFQGLGIYQGTVLTYVPYFYTLIPDDIFGDNLKAV